MATEPVWQPNYTDLSDDRHVRFGAQCVICDARYATRGERLDSLFVYDAIPLADVAHEIEQAKRSLFTEFDRAYSSILTSCYRCQRPACPDCWDDDNQMCGECAAQRGLRRSPFRGLSAATPIATGQIVRVEPGRHSDAHRPTWLNALIATHPADQPLGTPPQHPVVKPETPAPLPPPLTPELSFASSAAFALRADAPPASTVGEREAKAPPMPFPQSAPTPTAPYEQFPPSEAPHAFDRGDTSNIPQHVFERFAASDIAPAPPEPWRTDVAQLRTDLLDPNAMPLPTVPPDDTSPTWHASPEQPAWNIAGQTNDRPSTSIEASGGSTGKVECPQCGAMNYDFVTRCSNCQFQLIINCPRCQHLNPMDAHVCEQCGGSLTKESGWSPPHTPEKQKPARPAPHMNGERHGQPASMRSGRAKRTGGKQTTDTAQQRSWHGGSAIVTNAEAHTGAATLGLWGERLLTTIVVVFVVGLLTSVTTAELSATANDTLRAVFHVDIRVTLAHFIEQMQLQLERFRR